MADVVTLLDFWPSPFGVRVRIALQEKGVEYEYKEENLGEKSDLLLQMNPVHKKIPVLIHNGKPICESLIIVQYIDEIWKDKSVLLPEDPYQRAKAKFWADFIDKKIYDSGIKTWKSKAEAKEEAKKEFIEHLKLLEDELSENPYFGGENFGFVDVALLGFACWFYTYEISGRFTIEQECPKLHSWLQRCLQRESVKKVMPDSHKVYEFVQVLKKRFGLE